jgi:sphingomyelin phosphodiesterase acid-like 3
MFLLMLTSIYLLFGCGDGTNTTSPPAATTFPVVVFSDLHFNPFYDPTLFGSNPTLCTTADPSTWASIFQTSAITKPSAWGTDTNYPLLVLALASIKQNLGTSPVVIYTGDLIGHYLPTLFYQYCEGGSATQTPTGQQVAAMQSFTNKTVAFVTAQIRASIGNIPVMFAIGNIDSYTGYGPDGVFLSNTAQTFYTQFVNGTVDQQTFLSTFTAGGYYAAEPMAALTVIGLNTNSFALGVPGDNDSAVATELAWLDATLASAQAAGRKVWLLMHVPPGANTVTTAASAINGKIQSSTMMMYQSYQASFLQVLAKYPGLITMTLGAHTHMDEYRILSPSIVLDEVPAITPCFGENPAFKIFTLSQATFTPSDYSSLNYDLSKVPLPAQFSSYYTFSAAYSLQGPLGASLIQLYPELANNAALTSAPATPNANAQQTHYMAQYNSGNPAWNPGGRLPAFWNPVTPANWPVFACGIGKMTQLDFEDCVNSY